MLSVRQNTPWHTKRQPHRDKNSLFTKTSLEVGLGSIEVLHKDMALIVTL